MLSQLSNLISPSSCGWSAAVANPLDEIQRFYVTRAEIPLSERRSLIEERLCKINGFSPQLAKIVIEEWDELQLKQKASAQQPLVPSNPVESIDALQLVVGPSSETQGELTAPSPLPKLQLGQALLEAGLIGSHQIEVALMDARYRDDLRIGEIFALRGWIHQATADFFAEGLVDIPMSTPKQPIGQYLKAAKLLTQQQIDSILKLQNLISSKKFGEIAVSLSYLNPKTVDFILIYTQYSPTAKR